MLGQKFLNPILLGSLSLTMLQSTGGRNLLMDENDNDGGKGLLKVLQTPSKGLREDFPSGSSLGSLEIHQDYHRTFQNNVIKGRLEDFERPVKGL